MNILLCVYEFYFYLYRVVNKLNFTCIFTDKVTGSLHSCKCSDIPVSHDKSVTAIMTKGMSFLYSQMSVFTSFLIEFHKGFFSIFHIIHEHAKIS